VLAYYSYVESTCMAASIITLFTLLYLSVGHEQCYYRSGHANAFYIVIICQHSDITSRTVLLKKRPCKCFLHRSNMPTLRYNSVSSVIIEAAMHVLSTSTCMAASLITLFTLLYLSVDILLLCRKHLHGRFYNNTVRGVISEC
jgi:hypothetical protein